MWNNVTGIPLGNGSNFCPVPQPVIQNASYMKTSLTFTAMMTGAGCIVEGVRSLFAGKAEESFAAERRRACHAWSCLYTGVTTVAAAVLFNEIQS